MSLYALRRLTALVTCSVALVAPPAQAAWPERPITLVVPYPAGGVADTISRAVAREVGERLGQPVVIENRPGASGKIGLEMVRRAAPDGYTIGLAVPATMVLLPLADARFGIGPQDFQPISLACETYTVLVVDPRLKIRTLPEFIRYGRSHAGMTYASAGNGTSFHFGAALLAQKLGIDATHVAYKGESPAMSDVAAGHVQFMLATNSAKAFIEGGKLVPIAVDASRRVAALPDVPTFREQGVDYVSSGWIGYVGPRNLPANVTARLDGAFRAALQAPALRQTFTTMGYTPAEAGAPAMGKAIAQDQARFRPLVQSGAVKLD